MLAEAKFERYSSAGGNVCPTCGKAYKHKHHLKRHRDFECGVEPKFLCPYCPHRTRYRDSLMKHVLARHELAWKMAQQQHQRQQHFYGIESGAFEPDMQLTTGLFDSEAFTEQD